MDNPELSSPSDLPVDSDLEVEDSRAVRSKPVHLRWQYLGLVAVGGAIGTALREGLSLVLPPINEISWTILAINVVGAFLLGLVVESLARRGSDEGRRRSLRLLLGTGLLGGFTTYSSLATASAGLFSDGRPAIAIGYALGTLLLGAVGTVAGIAVAALQHRRKVSGSGPAE